MFLCSVHVCVMYEHHVCTVLIAVSHQTERESDRQLLMYLLDSEFFCFSTDYNAQSGSSKVLTFIKNYQRDYS